jgi:hypothetical protein
MRQHQILSLTVQNRKVIHVYYLSEAQAPISVRISGIAKLRLRAVQESSSRSVANNTTELHLNLLRLYLQLVQDTIGLVGNRGIRVDSAVE